MWTHTTNKNNYINSPWSEGGDPIKINPELAKEIAKTMKEITKQEAHEYYPFDLAKQPFIRQSRPVTTDGKIRELQQRQEAELKELRAKLAELQDTIKELQDRYDELTDAVAPLLKRQS